MTNYLKEISGKPGSGEAHIVFTNGAISNDIRCGQFFMTMKDREASFDEMRAYAKVGPQIAPNVDWIEINRILDTFESKESKR